MYDYEEEKFNSNNTNNEVVMNEIKNMFTSEIQKDYISKYFKNEESFPPSKSYEKIKTKLAVNPTSDILDLYYIDERKLDVNNICKNDKENINCFIGNVNLQQLKNGFSSGFENALDLLDKDSTINKPFGKGKLDLLEYISIIASRDTREINRYDKYLKDQVGKDMRRDVVIINNYDMSHILKQNEILKKFYDFHDEEKKDNKNNVLLTNEDCTNIVALFILGELNDKLGIKLTITEIYDKLMLLLTLLHQGIPGEIQILLKKYNKKIVDKINSNFEDEHIYTMDINKPEANDERINYIEYNNSNKYIKLIIEEDEISLYSVIYTRFIITGNFDEPIRDGHYFAVLHMNILNETYEIKYLTMNINCINYNYNPTKFEKIKENISENKATTSVGTLLTLGALSAIPVALLLGGEKTRKRSRRKQRKIKTYKQKQRKTKNKNNKRNKKNKRKTFKR
jgi:hypothetical protein